MNREPSGRRNARAPGQKTREKSRRPNGKKPARTPIPAEAGARGPLFPVVGIGASAGGLAALKTFFAQVPKDSGVAYVVIVHLSPEHESRLVEIMQPHVEIPVLQVTETTALEKNCVYVIPPNANLDAIDTHLRLTSLERRRQERAPIDHFFRTLAETHDGQAIGVVLTGTGSDGTLGLRRIKERGGLTVVQDPSEAEYDSMPRSAIASALVDLVLPVAKIPQALLRYVQTEPRLAVPKDGEDGDKDDRQFLQKAFAVIQARTGRDFSHYKRSTLLRRISRRMQFNHLQEPAAYLEFLHKSGDEVRALADDLLVNVTSFFRDPEVFEWLERNVIGRLFESKSSAESVRVWDVGCATGEEAYSLAILLLEEAARREAPPAIQVFASDLHRQSLEKARGGLYPGDIETDVRPDRLERFFQRENGGYRLHRSVRELVVFAQHNVLADPPFSRLDLVSCRNLFIYLDRNLHKQATELFHYALKPDGFLLLGSSESIDESELFQAEDKKCRVYRRRHVPAPEPRLPVFSLARPQPADGLPGPRPLPEPATLGALHQRIVEQYAPPSVLLGPDNHVVHFSAHAGRYFVHPGGAPTTSVFQIVREELRVELRSALSAARSGRKAVRTGPIAVRFDRRPHPVVLDLRPALDPDEGGVILLIFDEQPAPEAPSRSEEGGTQRAPKAGTDARIRRLEEERRLAEQRLQQIVKEYETGREDLRASNEELQSANEELRSTLEELETSKEELQSINEELQTVNQENRHKVEELSQLSSDLQNLFAATDIATIFLDRELRILRFTPKTAELFNVQASDRGRPLSDFTHRLGHDGLKDDARQVLERLAPIQREVRDSSGRWYLMRVLPYRAGDRIAGVVITFVEITQRKEMEDALRRAKEYSEQIIETQPEPLLVLTPDLVVQTANAAFYEHFQVNPRQTAGRKVYDLGNGQWNIPALRELLEKILPDNQVFDGYLVDHVFEDLGRRVMLVNGRRLDHMQLILLGINDITDRYDADQALRRSEERLRRMVNVEGVGVLMFDQRGTLLEANDAYLRMFGYSRADVARGPSWRDMTPPEYVDISEHQLEKLRQTGRLGPYEKEYLRKDGSRAWIVLAGAELGDGTVVEYCIDMTERKRMEQELRTSEMRLRMATEAAGMFAWEADLAAGTLGWSENAAAVIGCRPDELPDRMPDDQAFFYIAPDERPRVRRDYTDAVERRQETYTSEFQGRGPAPAKRYRAHGRILYDAAGAPLRIWGVTQDITEQKRVELALAEANQRLVEGDRRKNDFLAMLSHELRNPLAPIRNSLHIMDRAPPGGERARRAQLTIDRQVAHMTRLVEDLLDVTRITRGKAELHRETLDLNELAHRVVEDHRATFVESGVELEMQAAPEEVWVSGDRTRLSQVIGNLLQNAAKFTNRGGGTSVAVEGDPAGRDAIVRVRDTGRGISPDLLPHVFEPFTQTDTPLDRKKGGLGLGLALVKGVVEMHGGSVVAESAGRDQGATFTVILPRESAGPAETQQPRGEAAKPARRVLVIEDNADAAATLSEVLELDGHAVQVASSGPEGIERARSFKPDLVICDIGLPEMDGYAVARAMRADPDLGGVALVALTGYAAPEDEARAREAGFGAHLAKPPSMEALQRILAGAGDGGCETSTSCPKQSP